MSARVCFFLCGLFACGGATASEVLFATALVGAAAPTATFEEEVAERVNAARAACTGRGCPLPPLKLVAVLSGVARAHSRAMAERDFFSHCDPTTGSDPFARLRAAGYPYLAAAESIAGGGATPAAVLAQWMASRTHRANLLVDGARELGVGYFRQDGDLSNIDRDGNGDCDCSDRGESCRGRALTHYWTQIVGRRRDGFPLVIARERAVTATAAVELYLYGPAEASAVRLRNDGGDWSPWRAFTHRLAWRLGDGDGVRTVFAEVRAGRETYRACDTIRRTAAGAAPPSDERVACDGDGRFRPAGPAVGAISSADGSDESRSGWGARATGSRGGR